MSVMSIRIDDRHRKMLKAIASIEGKTMTEIITKLIEDYVSTRRGELRSQAAESDDMKAFLKLSEPTFEEWNNDEDAVYDSM